MEGVGERTLLVLVAFTALRLEYNWNRHAVDAPHLNRLAEINRPMLLNNENEANAVEASLDVLMH